VEIIKLGEIEIGHTSVQERQITQQAHFADNQIYHDAYVDVNLHTSHKDEKQMTEHQEEIVIDADL